MRLKHIKDTKFWVLSRKKVYVLDSFHQTCTCPGFAFGHHCKHLILLNEKMLDAIETVPIYYIEPNEIRREPWDLT